MLRGARSWLVVVCRHNALSFPRSGVCRRIRSDDHEKSPTVAPRQYEQGVGRSWLQHARPGAGRDACPQLSERQPAVAHVDNGAFGPLPRRRRRSPWLRQHPGLTTITTTTTRRPGRARAQRCRPGRPTVGDRRALLRRLRRAVRGSGSRQPAARPHPARTQPVLVAQGDRRGLIRRSRGAAGCGKGSRC